MPPLDLAWSPDSKWLAYPEKPTPEEPVSLSVISLGNPTEEEADFATSAVS